MRCATIAPKMHRRKMSGREIIFERGYHLARDKLMQFADLVVILPPKILSNGCSEMLAIAKKSIVGH